MTRLYIAIQVIAQGILGFSLGHSTVPLADAVARISPVLRLLMLAGAALSMFGWMSSDILASPRILFSSARDGFCRELLDACITVVTRHTSRSYATRGSPSSSSALELLQSFLCSPLSSPRHLYIAACAAAWQLNSTNAASTNSECANSFSCTSRG